MYDPRSFGHMRSLTVLGSSHGVVNELASRVSEGEGFMGEAQHAVPQHRRFHDLITVCPCSDEDSSDALSRNGMKVSVSIG